MNRDRSIRRLRLAFSTVVLAVLGMGCAAGPSPFSAEGSADPQIEIIVRNERFTTVTAYVEWDGRNARRMGEVSGGESETFTLDLRGQQVRVLFQRMGSASGGRISDDDREAFGTNVEPALARAGDRFEWTFRTDGYVTYIRLSRSQRGTE